MLFVCGIEIVWIVVYDSGRKGLVVFFNVEMGMLIFFGFVFVFIMLILVRCFF